MKCDIKDLKVKGVLDEDGVKNFLIEIPDGLSYCAMRQPNGKFTIGDDGVSRTLKQCKELVANDAVVYFADVTNATDDHDDTESKGAWDCVHPCALLILLAECDVSREEIDRTLDAFGWMTPEGGRDFRAAEESLERWSK